MHGRKICPSYCRMSPVHSFDETVPHQRLWSFHNVLLYCYRLMFCHCGADTLWTAFQITLAQFLQACMPSHQGHCSNFMDTTININAFILMLFTCHCTMFMNSFGVNACWLFLWLVGLLTTPINCFIAITNLLCLLHPSHVANMNPYHILVIAQLTGHHPMTQTPSIFFPLCTAGACLHNHNMFLLPLSGLYKVCFYFSSHRLLSLCGTVCSTWKVHSPMSISEFALSDC